MTAENSLPHDPNPGTVHQVTGPLVVGENMTGVRIYELVYVGPNHIVGEVIRIDGGQASIQVFEHAGGLKPGDPILKSGGPLCVELGPGTLDNIFDGTQRPLKHIAEKYQSNFIPHGVVVSSLDHEKKWEFIWGKDIAIGATMSGGDVIGTVRENDLYKVHKIMIPPRSRGKVIWMAEEGLYTVEEILMRIELNGVEEKIKMAHHWPVRVPRPVLGKHGGTEPLLTGQRVLDSLFPAILGGSCAIPGAFGCGKTCISQAVSKYSNSDVIVYVGCGERGNEMAEVLIDFPELKIRVGGEELSIMLRTCLIANTSNMPVAAREASIYTGITIAEYFRDQGRDVAMMADSTSRWAEALREISGRLGEMPADSGYPAYLGARLAEFYERAGVATALGSPTRRGSITIVAAVSPPGGDFSDPVTAATMSIVQVFWGLDSKLAQKKHFPSVNCQTSFSKNLRVLEAYYDNFDKDFIPSRNTINAVLQAEIDLQELVQVAGREGLAETQQLTLELGCLIRENFLQQSAFSGHDYTCPLEKTLAIMHVMAHYHDEALRAITETMSTKSAVRWSTIENATRSTLDKIAAMKFIDPKNLEAIAFTRRQLLEEVTCAVRSMVE